ncbi:MAG: PQQ-like beta-propeller repeat protein [Chitinispirillia bacterium]|nr:PQQ-like beta-propeller repeat protein [Chitinispirillia bacterium]MCL2241371.1 PQQ-like beta-propeller repeat protein [Chitinispirillia bacterium]
MCRISICTIVAGLVFMFMMSCSDNSNPAVNPQGGTPLLAVITIASDYSAGNFDIVLSDSSVSPNLIDGLHTDLAVRAFGSGVYIIERLGRDNIIKYDTKQMKIAYQQNLGAGLNLHDIAVVSEAKAYVSAYEDNNLIIFNPSAGAKTSTVDMSRFVAYAGTDSAEAVPYVSSLALYGSYLYAACQRLKIAEGAWGPAPEPGDTSVIAVIDTRSDEITGQVKLNKKNPASIAVFGNRMIVASTGSWFDITSGGVETIDLSSNVNLGVIAEGAALGGSVSGAAFVSANTAYISVMRDDWTTGIVQFNPVTGTIGAAVAGIEDGSGGMAFDGDKLYVGDRGFASAGVAVVNPSTGTVERLIPTSMPPAGLAVTGK